MSDIAGNILGAVIENVLRRPNVPVANEHAPDVTDAVKAAVTQNPNIAVVPVKSPFTSKINWYQVGMLGLGSLTIFGIDIDDATKLKLIEGIIAIQTVGTVILKTFFTKSVTTASAKK